MWKKRQRKILFFLLLGSVILFIGLMVEFVIHRYNTNRSVVFRTEGNSIQSYYDRKWQYFNINAVNMGPRKPGLLSDEMNIPKDEYARRFKEAAGAGVNVVWIYTVQPPAFYRAFFEYNMLTSSPLYLLHGITIDNYRMNAYEDQVISDFFEEIRRTVDVIHGDAVIRNSTGAAVVTYNLDISPYVMGYVLYCETNNDFIISTNDKNTHIIGFEGDYLYTENATPWEAWFAGVGNYAVSYEQDNYKAPYRLLSWKNPSADSADIITEYLPEEQPADFMHIYATEKFNAGFFISGHEYPSYPDLPSVLSLLQP